MKKLLGIIVVAVVLFGGASALIKTQNSADPGTGGLKPYNINVSYDPGTGGLTPRSIQPDSTKA